MPSSGLLVAMCNSVCETGTPTGMVQSQQYAAPHAFSQMAESRIMPCSRSL